MIFFNISTSIQYVLILQFSSYSKFVGFSLSTNTDKQVSATCLSWNPLQEAIWLKSIKIFLLLTQVVIGITALKPFKVKIISALLRESRSGAFPHGLY